MAKPTNETQRLDPNAAPREMILPDVSEFSSQPQRLVEGPSVGTVLGLDLKQWAYAIVDLSDLADRVEGQRFRLREKGYLPAKGEPVVVGFRKAEVWVIPRAQFEERRTLYKRRLYERVRNRTMSDAAVRRPHVELTTNDGIATPAGE